MMVFLGFVELLRQVYEALGPIGCLAVPVMLFLFLAIGGSSERG